MAEHGGYRKPTNPAPVSGPGAHSRRTDGQPMMDLPNAAYGENADFQAAQQGAPMATDSGAAAAPWSMPQVTGMGAPTGAPTEPVTSGAQYGPGPGTGALGLPTNQQADDADYFRKYLPTLIEIAQSDDTPPGTKRWVRTVIANLPH